MNIIECSTCTEYIAIIGNSCDTLLLVEFYAEWSCPSQVLSLELECLEINYPLVQHIRLNFNTCPVISI